MFYLDNKMVKIKIKKYYKENKDNVISFICEKCYKKYVPIKDLHLWKLIEYVD